MLFKKGDTENLHNYRPTSLLNLIYKLYATILQIRLDKHLNRNSTGYSMASETWRNSGCYTYHTQGHS